MTSRKRTVVRLSTIVVVSEVETLVYSKILDLFCKIEQKRGKINGIK